MADACGYNERHENAFIWMELEEHRLLDWAKTIALGSTNAPSQLDPSIQGRVMDILQQKQTLLYSFGRIDGSSKQLKTPDLIETERDLMFDPDTDPSTGEASAIRFPWTQLVAQVQSSNDESQIVLRKLKWIRCAEDEMKALIGHLMHFNEELHDALDKAQRERLRQEQLRTSYQFVALNRKVENLVRIILSQRVLRPSAYSTIMSRADAGHGRLTQPSAQES